MSHDPADTLSMVLPSLPPPAPGEGLSVLDPRFPMDDDHTGATPFFTRLVREWAAVNPGFALRETDRAARADAQAPVVRRFVQPLPPPAPAIAEPVVYLELAEATLTHEWDMGPREAIGDVDELPRRHRHRGEGGRFAAAGGA